MAAPCASGVGQLKLGTAAQQIIGSGLITAGLEELSPWLLPAGLLLDAITFEGTSDCPSGPPPMPTWDASDAQLLALGLLAPNAQTTISKMNAVILNYVWPLFCDCSTGVTPTPPGATVSPPGVGGSSSNNSQPCFTGHYQGTPGFASIGTPLSPSDDYTTALLPTTGSSIAVSTPAGLTSAHGAPAGVTTISATATGTQLTGDSSGLYYFPMDVFFYDASGTYLTSIGFPRPDTNTHQTVVSTAAVPSGTAYWIAAMDIRQNLYSGLQSACTYDTQVYCGGAGPGLLSNCCPPDPAIALALQTIIGLLNQILTPGAPAHPWIDGVRHSGLSGNGSFALSATNAVGVRLEVTTPPANAHILAGTPNFYWDMGFITPIALSSPLRGWRLVFLTQSFELPEFTDSIGYTLLDGTVADLVELLPATS